MKKILTLILILFFSVLSVQAKKTDNSINFYGKKYRLLYSTKDAEFGGYLNEYFKNAETYNSWSEMISVHHFPNAYSPIDQIKQFKEFLGKLNCPSALTFDDKKNSAMIDFIMINSHHVPIVLEFNIFKYKKSAKCGSEALQYSKRYAAYSEFELEYAKKDIERHRNKAVKRIKKFRIPDIVTDEMDLCNLDNEKGKTVENKSIKISDNASQESEKQDIQTQSNTAEISDETINGKDTENCEIITIEKTAITDKEPESDTLAEQKSEPIVVKEKEPENIPEEKVEETKVEVQAANAAEIEPKDIKTAVYKDNTLGQDYIEEYLEPDIITKKTKNKKVKKSKKEKSATYQIINDKSDLYQKEPNQDIKNVSNKEKRARVKKAQKKLAE